MSHFSESLSQRKYVSFEAALEGSGLTLPELKRATALSFIETIEVGHNTFIEANSLREYIEAKEEHGTALKEADTQARAAHRAPDADKSDTDRVFKEALHRDEETRSQLSIVPYVAVGALLVIAVLISLPSLGGGGETSQGRAERFYAHSELKEAAKEQVSALFFPEREEAPESARGWARNAGKEARFQGIDGQGAEAARAFVASVSGAVDSIAVNVYLNLTSLIQSLGAVE